MSSEARARIDAHRLMREPATPVGDARVLHVGAHDIERKKAAKRALMQRTFVHIGAFIAAFVFTAGIALLGVLLWVRPDTLLPLVLVSVICSIIFVAVFALIRMLVLHKLMNMYPNEEDDPGVSHHMSKSIAYGLLALVIALLLTGLLVNFASAFN
jgi:hypothetical protein